MISRLRRGYQGGHHTDGDGGRDGGRMRWQGAAR